MNIFVVLPTTNSRYKKVLIVSNVFSKLLKERMDWSVGHGRDHGEESSTSSSLQVVAAE